MKKFNKFGFASAIVLAGAMGFAACSSDDEEFVELNPTYDGNSVKTQFAISLTQKANKGGRMTSAEVGNAGFKGMKNIHLYEYAITSDKVASTDVAKSLVPLGNNTIAEQGDENTKAFNTLYTNVAFTTGVNAFLFYGETAVADNAGKTASSFSTTAGATTFTPVQIFDSGSNFTTDFRTLVSKLNAVYGLFDTAGLPLSVAQTKSVFKSLKAGSSEAILNLVEDVYNAVENIDAQITDTDQKEKTADLLAAILTNLGAKLDDANAAVGAKKLSWKTEDNYTKFPTKYGLPNGAVSVKLENGTFVPSTEHNFGAENISDYQNFVYPASLLFYANSLAMVRDTEYLAANYTSKTWAAIIGNDNYHVGAIGATTRSVVLQDQINYAVAQLKTTVQFADATSIPAGNNTNNEATTVSIEGKSFPVTGVLIGNQKQVDWQFAQVTTADAYTVYDANMTQTMTAGPNSATGANYTLVYESNAKVDESGASDVLVAIELENAVGDFYGVNKQIIPAGAKFYLVGKLEVDNGRKPTVNDVEVAIDKVFKQDYVTVANFTISSLANAYNVIPDLETPQMEFGMSVNLEWQTGLTFNVTIR